MRKAGPALPVLLCGRTLVPGHANKARCTGPTYDAVGRTTPSHQVRDVCNTVAAQVAALVVVFLKPSTTERASVAVI